MQWTYWGGWEHQEHVQYISLLKTILMKNGVELRESESKRGIFQGDDLYSITFHHCSDAS